MVVPAAKGNGVWATRAGCLSGQSAAVGVGVSPLLKHLLTLLTQCDTLQAVPCKVSHCVKSVSREATPPGTRREACPAAARQEWRTTGSYLRRTSGAEQPLCQSAAGVGGRHRLALDPRVEPGLRG